jgi:hypothetical protein
MCRLYGKSERPKFCESYRPSKEFCGVSRDEALERLKRLEELTAIP